MDEDVEAEAKIERTAYNPEPATTEDPRGKRKEGCSCIFGNPCVDAEYCENWSDRYRVAKENGWKGHS